MDKTGKKHHNFWKQVKYLEGWLLAKHKEFCEQRVLLVIWVNVLEELLKQCKQNLQVLFLQNNLHWKFLDNNFTLTIKLNCYKERKRQGRARQKTRRGKERQGKDRYLIHWDTSAIIPPSLWEIKKGRRVISSICRQLSLWSVRAFCACLMQSPNKHK